jgi:hypothetical protein
MVEMHSNVGAISPFRVEREAARRLFAAGVPVTDGDSAQKMTRKPCRFIPLQPSHKRVPALC